MKLSRAVHFLPFGVCSRTLVVRTGLDYCGRVDVQGLILQGRICLSRTLVSAQSALWVCHTWRGLDDDPAHFEAGHWGSSPRTTLEGMCCRSTSATAHSPSGATRRPERNPQMLPPVLCFEAPSEDKGKPRLAAARAGLGLLSPWYRTRSSQMFLVWVLQMFERP